MSPLVRLVLALYAEAFYLVKTVWPMSLSPLYGFPLDVTYSHLGLAAAGNLLALAAVRFAPALSATWAVYSLTLLPVSGIFHNGPQAVADRYSYLACLPWALWIGAAVAWRPRRGPALGGVALALRALVVAAPSWAWARFTCHAGICTFDRAVDPTLGVNPDSRDAHGYPARLTTMRAGVAEAWPTTRSGAALAQSLPWYVAIARVMEEERQRPGRARLLGEVLRSAPGSAEACAGLRRIGGHMELPPEMLTGCPTGHPAESPAPGPPPGPS